MENNKYNKYYSKKAVSVLIGQIIYHRITGATIDKEWYEALKKHLSERNITDKERKIVGHILSADPEVLKQEQQNSSDIFLKTSGINAAGKSLKNIIYVAIILILSTTIGIFVDVSSKDLDTIQNIYIFIGIISLFCNFLILNTLYTAGDYLENS